MKIGFFVLGVILISASIIANGELIAYDYGMYSVKDNVSIAACFGASVDKLYANITRPNNTSTITTLYCSGGVGYCSPSYYVYCVGVFTDAGVSGVYNVSFFSNVYEFSESFEGYFAVFERTFLNVTFPLNNTVVNNRTIIFSGLTSGSNISVSKNSVNFTVIVINETFSFPLNLSEGENIINITAYGSYKYPNSNILRIIFDSTPETEPVNIHQGYEEEMPKISLLPIVNTAKVKANETKFIETSLKISDDEHNTIGVVTFNTSENEAFNAYSLRFINKTIFFESESGEKKFLNTTAEIGFWDDINGGGWSKDKIGFEISNGKMDEKVIEVLDSVSMERKKEQEREGEIIELREGNEIIELLHQDEKPKILLPENINEKNFETEVRDREGNLIKNKEVEVKLSNGEKIKVKTDENGKIMLTMKDGKISQIKEVKAAVPENLEEGKEYELEVKDKEGNLIKNSFVSIKLSNGQMLNIITDNNGKIKLQYKNNSFVVADNKTDNRPYEIEWYYFSPLLLIPLILFFVLSISKKNGGAPKYS